MPATSAEEPPLRSYTINLADEVHARTAPSQPSGPQQPAPIPAAAPDANPAPPPAAAQPPLPPPSPRTAAPTPASAAHTPAATTGSAEPASASAKGYVVQLGSFASRGNADRLARQVRTQGFPVSVSQGSSGRRLYRVRVGPAHDRAAASQLASQLLANGHRGSIVPE